VYSILKNPSGKIIPQEVKPNHESRNSIQEKILFLNNQTTLELVYNEDVTYYIDLYLNERRDALEGMLQRSEIYFPVIEEYLDKYDLPFELKYLAALESGLNPLARSKSGALGLWQFLYSTCNLLDLEVTTYTDDRYDIYLSTDAACRYLEYLYRIFGNWELALAAYNDGPGTVERAIIRSGGVRDYWKLREFLPFQSSEYIPALIAFNYLFKYYSDHDISYVQPVSLYKDLDTIYVNSSLYFRQIAKATNLKESDIRLLNPRYKKNYIPKTDEPQLLILPDSFIKKYLSHEYKIVNNSEEILPEITDNKGITYTCKTHVVQKGEFYHKLAMKYDCTIDEIKMWNKIDSNKLHPGQTLTIWEAKTK
jgi:membrane-bound lytic murein transglycosylase D